MNVQNTIGKDLAVVDNLHNHFPNILDGCLESLESSLIWESHDPDRKECFFLRKKVPYYYGGRRGFELRPLYPQKEPAELKVIWEAVYAILGIEFDACFVNYYTNHTAGIGFHGDNSPSIDETMPICTVSIGGSCTFSMRCVEFESLRAHTLLENGTLLSMNPGIQKRVHHSVSGLHEQNSRRISLVFRKLSGYVHR